MQTHVELVRTIARVVRRELALPIDLGDLEGYGFEGLIAAAERFRFDRGAKFATFAGYRIRGAMYDALRVRFPTGWMSRLDDDDALEWVSDDADAEQITIDHEAHARLHLALEKLPPRERDVLQRVYFEGQLLIDVAALLGLSKWSATRLHTRAVKQLRRALEELP